MREVDVMGVRVEMPSNQPIVLLREITGERYLPIWIGAVEATAIAAVIGRYGLETRSPRTSTSRRSRPPTSRPRPA